MRYMGLDLGTTSLGLAISDKSGMISMPMKVLKFPKERYDLVLEELLPILEEKQITVVVLGLPKNMDNSEGFAAQRSRNFAQELEKYGVTVHFYDERLSTVEAMNILKSTGNKKIKEKNIVDAVSASIILEGFLKGIQ
ncbi:MAG: Holliday junction resolvase RuvX [Bacilli bacterium]|nr:Holliday junction resolvase RuvX [Bacilli bacterium]